MLILGLSGVTCSGKTTLALKIKELLPNTHVIFQDDYFRKEDDPKHTFITELNHINFDIMSSLNMEKMYLDVQNYIQVNSNKCLNNYCSGKVAPFVDPGSLNDLQERAFEKVKTSNTKILIVEGFCIFSYELIRSLCNLKYFLTLPKEECFKRRSKRIYEPPDCPNYFEVCVWPEYKKHIDEIQNSIKDIHYIDTQLEEGLNIALDTILLDIINYK